MVKLYECDESDSMGVGIWVHKIRNGVHGLAMGSVRVLLV
jgi:hypothetical protein